MIKRKGYSEKTSPKEIMFELIYEGPKEEQNLRCYIVQLLKVQFGLIIWFYHLRYVLVCSGCYKKILQTGQPKQQTYVSSFWRLKSRRSRSQSIQLLGRAPFLACRWPSSGYIHGRKRVISLSLSHLLYFYKATETIRRAYTYDHILTSQRPYFQIPLHWGFQHTNLWGTEFSLQHNPYKIVQVIPFWYTSFSSSIKE